MISASHVSDSDGFVVPGLEMDPNKPFTIEFTALPIAFPTTPTANSPLMNLGRFSLKQYSNASGSTWQAVSTSEDQQLTYVKAGDCGLGRRDRIAVVFTGDEIRTFLDGRRIETASISGAEAKRRQSRGDRSR